MSGTAAEAIERHINVCADCRSIVAETAKYPFSDVSTDGGTLVMRRPPAVVTRFEPGTQIGRYVVRDVIGSGGMGIVYTAHDPGLDRKVALKLLRPDLDSERPIEDLQARLVREAQAMARLSHPNVVTVYDVGTYQGQVFVAMELVAGSTLKRWLAERPRAWRDVLAVFGAAGRGLAAAHATGLVHRDFKPENVLLTREGEPKVTDFGLACTPVEADDGGDRDLARPSRPWRLAITQSSAVVGTPAYMAPEQFLCKADARSDQFSFCVAMFEALFGDRPFEMPTFERVFSGAQWSTTRTIPVTSQVPASIRSALMRGLASEPDQRFASMEALLAALALPSSRPRPRVRARFWVAGAVVAAVGAVTWFGSHATPSEPEAAAVASPAPRVTAPPPTPAPAPAPAVLSAEAPRAADPPPPVEKPPSPPAPVRAAPAHQAKRKPPAPAAHAAAPTPAEPAPPAPSQRLGDRLKDPFGEAAP
jgi:hypothetical protein